MIFIAHDQDWGEDAGLALPGVFHTFIFLLADATQLILLVLLMLLIFNLVGIISCHASN